MLELVPKKPVSVATAPPLLSSVQVAAEAAVSISQATSAQRLRNEGETKRVISRSRQAVVQGFFLTKYLHGAIVFN